MIASAIVLASGVDHVLWVEEDHLLMVELVETADKHRGRHLETSLTPFFILEDGRSYFPRISSIGQGGCRSMARGIQQ